MCEKKLTQNTPRELTDDQLDNVVGGATIGDQKEYKCSTCDAQVLHEYRGDAGGAGWYCTVCGSRRRSTGLLMVG